ncbi:MAG: photosynthetic reaction center cytochrome c subunit family protein [Acidobacteriota bacterium]|nr:photosynthetic reaction center cytochrome c subunit family protein [Acidobacteriota bacterium]
MLRTICILLFGSSLLFAQSDALSGVWKADLQKSKLPGPPLKDYLEIIEQSGPKITETTGSISEHGDSRSVLIFQTDKPTVNPYEGVPTRVTAQWEGNTLNLTAETAARPDVMKKKYELSADGQTLTITSDATMNGHERQSTLVLLKQPDAAGEMLRKPQATAEERFKNVKTRLKTLPSSEFIDHMHYFAWSLGKNCEFCHVQGHFDSDDKKEKRTARDMIAMVGSIDTNNFGGRPEVRCFTCHEGHSHPLSRPLYPGEPEPHHEHAEAAAQTGQHQ